MEVRRLSEMKSTFNINVLVYGSPGVGKTTFGANADGVLIADVENGSNMLALSGIEADVVRVEKWEDMREVYALAEKYKTLVIDPLGELLEKLIQHLKLSGYANAKGDGLTLQGWGVAKDKFKDMLRAFRDLDIDLCLVAHSQERQDEDHMVIRPKLSANLDTEVCAMMDVVGYMTIIKTGKETSVRRTFFEGGERFYAKDRSGLLGQGQDDTSMGKVVEMIRSGVAEKTASIQYENEKKGESFIKELEHGKKKADATSESESTIGFRAG